MTQVGDTRYLNMSLFLHENIKGQIAKLVFYHLKTRSYSYVPLFVKKNFILSALVKQLLLTVLKLKLLPLHCTPLHPQENT